MKKLKKNYTIKESKSKVLFLVKKFCFIVNNLRQKQIASLRTNFLNLFIF